MTRRPRPGNGERRRTAAELDALLDGGRSGDPRLDQVLSAARGPARPHELSTPAPAVGVDTPADAPSRSRRVLTRLGAATLVTKAVTVSVGAAVVGAAAVAGATHHLPGQTRPRPPVVSTPSASARASGSAPSSDAPRSSSSATRSPSPSSTSPTASPSASAAAAVPTLCRAWLALPPGADAERRAPRFEVLIRAAGSVPAVTTFCRTLPTRSPSGSAPSSTTAGSSPSPSPSRTTPTTKPKRSPTASLTR